MKKNWLSLNIMTVLGGMYLSRVLSEKYGNIARVRMGFIALMIIFGMITYYSITKRYLQFLSVSVFSLPFVVMFVGVYWENVIIGLIGLLLMFIIIPIMIKVLPKYTSKEDDYIKKFKDKY